METLNDPKQLFHVWSESIIKWCTLSLKSMQMYEHVQYETSQNSFKLAVVGCLNFYARIFYKLFPQLLGNVPTSNYGCLWIFLTLQFWFFSNPCLPVLLLSQNSYLLKVNNELSFPSPSPFLFMETSFSI